MTVSILPTITLNYVGEKYWGIEKVPARESLSIPLQQTARYLKEHFGELTQEEKDVLNNVFTKELSELPYAPEISDGIKILFRTDATDAEVAAYLKIWIQQFGKHPDTYFQALLNHTYGYFYPNRQWMQEWNGTYALLTIEGQYLKDEAMDVEFGIKNKEIREFYRNAGDVVNRMPLIGMLYSCGLQNYCLIGCIAYLLHHKKKKGLIMLLPCAATVVMCILSPANAYLRYMLPVMALMPVNIAWCHYAVYVEKDFIGGVKVSKLC